MMNTNQQLEMVKRSKRADKENYLLELLLTETADDYEQSYEAATIGAQTLREYVEQAFNDDEAGCYTLAMQQIFFEQVDWNALTDYIVNQRG